MKRNRILLAIMVLVMMFSITAAYAKTRNDAAEYERSAAVLGVKADGDSTEPAPEPAPAPQDPGTPSAPSVPGPDTGAPETPAQQNSKLYYSVIPKEQVPNLESFCAKYGAYIIPYRAFNQLLVLKRAGVVIGGVDPKNAYFKGQLRKRFNAKPLTDVSLRVKINVYSVLHGVNITKDQIVTGDFGGCDEIVQKAMKVLYGGNCSMFKTIGKYYPGLLDKVTVLDKEFLGLGKKRKVLYSPTVTLEMLALNMNGKGKNVTLFYQNFYYKTIKHASNYHWSK